MVSKLSDNGVAGFILANGALSGGSEEYKIRKKLVENGLVEAIVILPQNMFYTTDISVTLWILNNNKKERTYNLNDNVKTTEKDKMNSFHGFRENRRAFRKEIHSILLMNIFRNY